MNSLSTEGMALAPARSKTPDPSSSLASSSPNAFEKLGLMRPLLRALDDEGYSEPTPIQAQAIPHLLEGRDLFGSAQTGTGKTAAFVLPILQRLTETAGHGKIRALVVTPTRELAAQIAERASAYGRHLGVRNAVIYGGVGQRAQEQSLARKPDLLVATPGRLLDLMEQGFVRLDAVEVLVLDEADRMLDMGFIHDVRRIISAIPRRRQTLLFSATMPNDIGQLARDILRDPLRVSVTPKMTAAETVAQFVHFVERTEKQTTLERLLAQSEMHRVLVFTRTKRGAERVCKNLRRAGFEAAAIHGDKSQGQREAALRAFRGGKVDVLVATDVAARGIDVDAVSHVLNYDLPNEPEAYVHRIGRTGRAGAVGTAISFCAPEERGFLRDIERLLRKRIDVHGEAPVPTQARPEPRRVEEPRQQRRFDEPRQQRRFDEPRQQRRFDEARPSHRSARPEQPPRSERKPTSSATPTASVSSPRGKRWRRPRRAASGRS